MVAEPYVWNVPTARGGVGHQEVKHFYQEEFIGKMPPDAELVEIGRTVGQNRVVVELVVSFTHDREIPWLLPAIPPTGRKVELALVVVMGFENDKIAYERIYWDQASLLVQVGLLDPDGLPVVGGAQARSLLELCPPVSA